jgi:archaellum component FlaC
MSDKERLDEALGFMDRVYEYLDGMARMFSRLEDTAADFSEKSRELKEEYERLVSKFSDEDEG